MRRCAARHADGRGEPVDRLTGRKSGPCLGEQDHSIVRNVGRIAIVARGWFPVGPGSADRARGLMVMAMVVTGVVPPVMVLPITGEAGREVEMWSCCRSVRGGGVRVPSRDSTDDHVHDHQQYGQRSHWHSWHERTQPIVVQGPCCRQIEGLWSRSKVVTGTHHRYDFPEDRELHGPDAGSGIVLVALSGDLDTPENSASENRRRSPFGRSLLTSQLFRDPFRPFGNRADS
jgi:hypothetical protein